MVAMHNLAAVHNRRMPAVAACILAAVVVLAGCAEPEEPFGILAGSSVAPASTKIQPPTGGLESETGTIRGVVTSDELVPISNATIHATGLGVGLLTSSEGTFEITGVPPGKHVVEAQAPGYVGQSNKVEVKPGEDSMTRFMLRLLAITEPRVVVLPRSTLIHYGAPGQNFVQAFTPGSCSDNCTWWVPVPSDVDHVVLEVAGKHAVPHPMGWDGLYVDVKGYPANGTDFRTLFFCSGGPYLGLRADCHRLPMNLHFPPTKLHDQNETVADVARLKIPFSCEPSWVCVEERYEAFASLFYDWEGEIPPDYSAQPGG